MEMLRLANPAEHQRRDECLRLASPLGHDQHAADPCLAFHTLVVEQRTAGNRPAILRLRVRGVVAELGLACGVGDLFVEHDGRVLVAERQRTRAAPRGLVRLDPGLIQEVGQLAGPTLDLGASWLQGSTGMLAIRGRLLMAPLEISRGQ